MERTSIAELKNHIGQKVKVQGWLQTLRDQKKMQFLVLRDPSGCVQVTFEKAFDPGLAGKISELAPESALTITGDVIENPIVKLGGIEIILRQLLVENPAGSPLPLDPFASTLPELDYRLDWRYLDLRRPQNLLIFKVQTTAEMAMRQYWLDHNFIEIHSPKLMGSPSESGAELFELDYFERKAYLAQSPQFYKQMAIAAGFDRVFEIGPVFRADPSFTSRHMTEFTSVDMEMAWIDSHEDVMAFQERWMQYTCQQIVEKYGAEIRALLGVDLKAPEVPFPRLTMAEAHDVLARSGYSLPHDKKDEI
ncbi:MAG: aspartate--tRNA(Asn) ligase, partial [Chloroflexota bacterium]